MPRLVYIPAHYPGTWLHWSWKGNASCLRDYRDDPPTEYRDRTTNEIELLLAAADAQGREAERIAVHDTRRWRKIVSALNIETGLLPIPELPDEDLDDVGVRQSSSREPRLVDRFIEEVTRLLAHDRRDELSILLKSWSDRLVCIKNKIAVFNHWDDDEATRLHSDRSGIGWTSRWLEHSRSCGQPSYLALGDAALDIAVISIELNLSISKNDNLFRNAGDSVNPDAIAIRRDRSMAVVEVKGPLDDHDWEKATLQGLCGVLALHAKRNMIAGVARTRARLRLAIDPELPPTGRTLGLYVVNWAAHAMPEHRIRMLLDACPVLREVVHCAVPPDATPSSAFSDVKVYRA
jgi:hypothetical protein